MRRAAIYRYLGGIMLMSGMAAALLLTANAADPPVSKSPSDVGLDDPFPIHRVLLSGDRLAKELERAKQGILVQMPATEFEGRVRNAAKAQKIASEEPRLLETHYYQARLLNTSLEDNGLEGTARWMIHPGGSSPAILPVDGMQLAVRSARWPDDRLAIFSGLDVQNPNRFGLLLEHPTDKLLEFSWSARGIPTPSELRFDLAIPTCPQASLDLELPRDWIPFLSQSEALLTGPFPIPDSSRQTWHIAFGGLTHLELFLRPRGKGQRTNPIRTRSVMTVQEIHPALVFSQSQIEFEALHGGVTDLVVEHDPEWVPSEVSLLNLETWKRDSRPGRLLIHLREPASGGQLRIAGSSPIHANGATAWISPGIKLADSIAGPEQLAIRIVPELQLADWKPGSFRLKKREISTDGVETLSLQSGIISEGSVDNRPRCKFQLVGSEYAIQQDTFWNITPERSSLTSTVKLEVLHGTVGHIPLRVPEGWELDRIVGADRDPTPSWSFQRGPDSQVFVDLLRPVLAGNDVTLILHLTQRKFDPSKASGLSIAFPDAIPLGASRRSGTLTVRVSPAFYALASEAIPEAEPQGPSVPATTAGRNTWQYSYSGPAPIGTLHLRLGSPRLKVISDTHIYRVEGRPEVSTRLQLRPEVSGRRALTLLTWVPIADNVLWKTSAGNNAVTSVQRLPQSPLSMLAGLGGRTGLDSVIRAATPRAEEWWQVTFARPLDQPVTLEIAATTKLSIRPIGEVPGLSGLAGTAAGLASVGPSQTQNIPLFQVIDASESHGEITLAIQPGSGIEWQAYGLTSITPRSSQYPSFQHGSGMIGLTWIRKDARAAASVSRLDGATLTTRADRTGARRCRLKFRIQPGDLRSLPVRFPEGTTIEGATIDGQNPDGVSSTVHAIGPGVECRLPIPAGMDWRIIEIVYTLPPLSGSLLTSLASPVPTLPVPFPDVRRIWHLGPGLLPVSSEGLIRRPGGADPAIGLPWTLPHSWRDWLDPENLVTSDAEAAWARPSSTAGTSSRTFQQTMLQLASQQATIVLDSYALSELGITPTRFVPVANGLPAWEPLGLVAVGIPSGAILTTPRILSQWHSEAADRHRLPASISGAVQEASRSGHDFSGRFRTAGDWAEAGRLSKENDFVSPVYAEESGWTTWESTALDTPSIRIVYIHSWRTLGWAIAGVFTALAILLFGRVGQYGLVLLAIWLAGSGLLLNVLPVSLREIVIGPMLAGLLVAVMVVWRGQRYLRRGLNDRTELIRPSSRKRTLVSGLGGSAVFIALCVLPTHAAAPEPAKVLLVAPKGDAQEPNLVLVAPDLLDRLSQASERKLPLPGAVIARVEYKGRFSGKSDIEIEARFYLRSFVDSAELILPLSGVRLSEALLGGAKAFAQADGVDRYRFTLNKRGDDHLDLKFSIKVNGAGSEREAHFGVPEVLQSELRFSIPGDIEGFQVVNWRGIQQSLDQGRQLQTYLGRTRQVYLRWREPGATSVAQVRVQQASLWDIHPDSASLLSVFDYRITQEGVTRFRIAVPKGLEVARLEVRPDSPIPTPLPAWIKDWTLTPESVPGIYRTLAVDLHMSLSGSVRMVLELVPLRPITARPELRFPAALDVIEAQARVAYRLSGLDVVGEPARNGLVDFSPQVFVDETWKRINEVKNPLPVTRAYRKLPDRDVFIRPVLRPIAPASTGVAELVWWLDPQRWDVRGDLRFTASDQFLSLVEWDISQAVKIHSVRGLNVDRWTRTASRVQVWLKHPAREVHLVWNGFMIGSADPPETISLDLPGIRLDAVAYQDTTIRLRVPEGMSASTERLEMMGRLLNPQWPRETAIQLTRPQEGLRVAVRTPERDASFAVVSTVEIKDGNLSIRSELRAVLRKDRPHSFAVRVGRVQGMTGSLDVPNSCRIVDSVILKDERSWSVEVAPRERDNLLLVLTLQRAIVQPAELVLPSFSVTQGAYFLPRFENLYALFGSELQVLKAKQFRELSLTDLPVQRIPRNGGSIWKQQDISGELSVLASPTTLHRWSPIRIAMADLQAARQGDEWIYRGSFEILHAGPSEVHLELDEGSSIEGAVLDGIEVSPRPPAQYVGVIPGSPNSEHLDKMPSGLTRDSIVIPLSAEGGNRLFQCVWRRSKPAWETPAFLTGSRRVPIDRTLWTIDLPQGTIAAGMEPASAAALDLQRAETLLEIAGETKGFPISEEGLSRAIGRALGWIRISEAQLAGRSSRSEERTQDGKSLADRAKQLRDRALALRAEHPRAETVKPGSTREGGFQQLPYADSFQQGIPVRYILSPTEHFLSIQLQQVPSDSWRTRWMPLLIVGGAVGAFSALLLLGRRSTRPEQLAMIGILGAASFHFPQGVVFLALTLVGALMRLTWTAIWLLRKLQQVA